MSGDVRAADHISGGGARRPREVTGRTVLLCLVAFFGVVGAVNAVMVRAAISTFGGLESDSAYKAGLNYAREIAASEEQAARHWNVTVHVGPVTDGAVGVELGASDAQGRPLVGYHARVKLEHPTNRKLDRSAALDPAGAGRFAGRVAAEPGQRELVIAIERGGERLFMTRERVTLQAVRPK